MIENVTNIILFNNKFLAPVPISLNGFVTTLTIFIMEMELMELRLQLIITFQTLLAT